MHKLKKIVFDLILRLAGLVAYY